MRAILRGIAGENSATRRDLTGQGEPGYWTLLGGSNSAPAGGSRKLAGGAGQGALARVERLMTPGGTATSAGGLGPGGVESIRNPRDPTRQQ